MKIAVCGTSKQINENVLSETLQQMIARGLMSKTPDIGPNPPDSTSSSASAASFSPAARQHSSSACLDDFHQLVGKQMHTKM